MTDSERTTIMRRPFRLCLDVTRDGGPRAVWAIVCTTLWQNAEGMRILWAHGYPLHPQPRFPLWLRLLARTRLLSIHAEAQTLKEAEEWLGDALY